MIIHSFREDKIVNKHLSFELHIMLFLWKITFFSLSRCVYHFITETAVHWFVMHVFNHNLLTTAIQLLFNNEESYLEGLEPLQAK